MDGTPREVLVRVEELRAIGLDAPHTVELLHGLRQDGFDVPLDALGIGECAEAIVQALASGPISKAQLCAKSFFFSASLFFCPQKKREGMPKRRYRY